MRVRHRDARAARSNRSGFRSTTFQSGQLFVGFRSLGVGLSGAPLLAQVNAPLNVFPAEHPLGFKQIVALATQSQILDNRFPSQRSWNDRSRKRASASF